MSNAAVFVMATLVSAVSARSFSNDRLRKVSVIKPEETPVVQPFQFNQRFLVCNAYPSDTPVTIKKNSQEMLADESHPIAYKECRYLSTRVLAHDKMDFNMKETGIEGTFEVGDLPASDAVLLLVVERRDAASKLLTFQSFAFPSSSDAKDAQLAAIDTYRASSDAAPRLKMEDHFTGKEAQTVSKRIEELNFDRVYAIEAGAYDASVLVRQPGNSTQASDIKRELALRKGENFVVLRVGDGAKFPQSLVVFPELATPHSGATAAGGLLLAMVSALVGFAA